MWQRSWKSVYCFHVAFLFLSYSIRETRERICDNCLSGFCSVYNAGHIFPTNGMMLSFVTIVPTCSYSSIHLGYCEHSHRDMHAGFLLSTSFPLGTNPGETQWLHKVAPFSEDSDFLRKHSCLSHVGPVVIILGALL